VRRHPCAGFVSFIPLLGGVSSLEYAPTLYRSEGGTSRARTAAGPTARWTCPPADYRPADGAEMQATSPSRT